MNTLHHEIDALLTLAARDTVTTLQALAYLRVFRLKGLAAAQCGHPVEKRRRMLDALRVELRDDLRELVRHVEPFDQADDQADEFQTVPRSEP